jgi:NAD-dependent SIR2 family protein deacetylase
MFNCARCGEPWPGEDDVDAGAEWVLASPGEVPVCPGCATPYDREREER